MIDRIQKLIDEANSFTTNSAAELEAFRIKFLGKKGLLNDLFAEEIPNVDVQVNITSEYDYYDNFYATKKQRFELDYKDSYLVCS